MKNTYRKGLFIMSKKLVAFFSASGTTKKVAPSIEIGYPSPFAGKNERST